MKTKHPLPAYRLAHAAALTLAAAACEKMPTPEQPGAFYYVSGEKQFVPIPKYDPKVISARWMEPETIRALKTIPDEVRLFVRTDNPATDNLLWRYRQMHAIAGQVSWEAVPGKTSPEVVELKPVEPGPGGVNVITIRSGSGAGTYAFVAGHNLEWEMEIGETYSRKKMYSEAVTAFTAALASSKGNREVELRLTETLLQLGRDKEATEHANLAWQKAKDEKEEKLLPYGVALAEAKFRVGSFADALVVFDELDQLYPSATEHKQKLAEILERVKPRPEDLIKDIYAAAFEGGSKTLEAFVSEDVLDGTGSTNVQKILAELTRLGPPKRIEPVRTKIFGRTARVTYKIIFARSQTHSDREMNFYLDKTGVWRLRSIG